MFFAFTDPVILKIVSSECFTQLLQKCTKRISNATLENYLGEILAYKN